MRKLIKYLFLLAMVVGINSTNAQGVIHKLNPTDDTYTYSDNTIRGMDYTINTYHSTAGSQYRRISFLKFDISSLSPHIQSVKLRLYCNGFVAGGNAIHEFDLYPVAKNTWAEDDISFNNYLEKVGADVTTPLLAFYSVALGVELTPQYIELSGANLTQMIIDSINGGKKFISFRLREKNVVKNGTSAVVVEFHSKENPSGFAPELTVEEKDIEMLKASYIKVNNSTITGFSENTYRYSYLLPWNATVIPTVAATPKYVDGTTVSIVQATSLTTNETERTAKISLQRGTDILTYSVVFQLLPPPTDPRLAGITIDGKPLEFFSMNTDQYIVYLPYSATGVPALSAQTFDPNASVQITPALEITPDKTVESRTARFVATSANGLQTKTYTVVFQQLPELDIILAIGQSNMSGRAPYADATAPMENVYLMTPAGEMEISSNPMNKYSNIRKDLSVEAMGPSYTCALKLQNYLKKPIGFVVNAQGGSSITAWYMTGKSNYDAALSRAKQVQRFGRIRAIIWHQGSADNSAGLLDNFVSYKSKLGAMVQNFRTDLNEPDMFFVCGELAERTEFDQFSATVILPVATYITKSDFVVTEGTTLLSDGIHFDEPSVKLLGERYADKLIEHVFGTSTKTSVVNKNTNMPKVSIEDKSVKIENINSDTLCSIYDVSGKKIKQMALTPNENINFSIAKGIYFLSFASDKNTETLKLLIQ